MFQITRLQPGVTDSPEYTFSGKMRAWEIEVDISSLADAPSDTTLAVTMLSSSDGGRTWRSEGGATFVGGRTNGVPTCVLGGSRRGRETSPGVYEGIGTDVIVKVRMELTGSARRIGVTSRGELSTNTTLRVA